MTPDLGSSLLLPGNPERNMRFLLGFMAVAGMACALQGQVSAAEPADELLKTWTRHVDQDVEVAGCYLTWAQTNGMYCDAQSSGLRLYFDMASIDPQTLDQAISLCPDWELRPECKVTLHGTLRANFGSPMLYDAVAEFAQ
jgi:hypothetical protein